MTKSFLILAIADINELLTIKDSLVDLYIDPVYENGKTRTGEVIVSGVIFDDADEATLSAIIQDYLREYVEFVSIRKVQFTKRKDQLYKKTG